MKPAMQSITIVVFFALCMFPSSVSGQDTGTAGQRAIDRATIRQAVLEPGVDDGDRGPLAVKRRSVPLAFGLSAVLPGVGQAYNRQWIKAGVAALLEVGLISGYVLWQNQGLDLEREYQRFAHNNWSPAQYALWLGDYRRYLEERHGGSFGHVDLTVPAGVDFRNPGDWTPEARRLANDFFDRIRSLERQLFHSITRATFSHTLPYLGDQQYYELIGKYFQFAPGWSDYAAWIENGEYTRFIDPGWMDEQGNRPNASPQFHSYASDHHRSNDLLRRSQRVASFLLLSHAMAAVDAAISAKLHNDRFETSLGLNVDVFGFLEPSASIRLRL
jgi:hypothetical protein